VHLPFSGVLLMVVSGIVGAVILALLATLGGVIGVAIFEKRKDATPPRRRILREARARMAPACEIQFN